LSLFVTVGPHGRKRLLRRRGRRRCSRHTDDLCEVCTVWIPLSALVEMLLDSVLTD
jgi:hypothetical protein